MHARKFQGYVHDGLDFEVRWPNGQHEDDDDDAEVETKKAKGKSSAKKKAAKQKAVCEQKKKNKAKQRKAKAATGPYKPGQYSEARKKFIADLRQDGMKFRDASNAWATSDAREQLLAGMSEAERKRRRF